MFIWPDCIPCILNMSLKNARFVMKEENQVRRFINEILAWRSLRGEGWHVRSPEIVRDVWIKLQEFSGGCHPCCTFHKVPLGTLIVYNF